MGDHKKRLRKQILVSVVFVFSFLMILSIVPGVKLLGQETEKKTGETAVSENRISPELAAVKKFAFIAAAMAFGLGAIGAGVAIGNVGAAAMGAISEKPEEIITALLTPACPQSSIIPRTVLAGVAIIAKSIFLEISLIDL